MTSAASDESRIRVLLVTPVPPPLQGGIVNWTRMVRAELEPRDDVELSFVDTMVRYGVVGGMPRLSRLVFGTRQSLRDTWRLWRALAQKPFDVMHLNSSAGLANPKDIMMLAAARRRGIPSVIQYHTGVPLGRLVDRPLERQWIRRSATLASAVATLDSGSEDRIRRLLPHKRVVRLRNMVDLAAVEQARAIAQADKQQPADGPRILFVGRVYPRKGVRDLVEACLKIAHLKPRLDVVGYAEAESMAEINAILAPSGAAEQIRFHGPKSHDEVIQFLFATDLFVLPTYGESAPMVVLEAMACGVPVISTSVGAIPEMLACAEASDRATLPAGQDPPGEQCGLCVSPGDVAALASALAELWADPVRRRLFGQRGRARAERLYAAGPVCRDLLEFWKSL